MHRNSYTFISLFIIASCGGGGGGGGSPSTPSTPAPAVNLSAEPTSVLLESTSTLTWTSTNATSCSASWTSQTGTSGSEAVTITTAGNNSFSISCTGDGGSRSASVTVEGYRETDGVVVDGYISGAEVCIDEDESWTCDSNENTTTSDNEGKFTIRYANGKLVSIGGTDLDSQTLLDNLLITHKLTGHSDFKAVTPVTSVAAFMEDASLVNAALGIDSSIDVFTFDPVANKGDGGINDYLYEKGNQLTVLAYALQNITNNLNTTTETTQDYFEAITEEIEKEYTETETKVDIETEAFVTKALENVIEAKSVTIDETAKANVTKALSGMIPIIQVKPSDDLTTGVIRFAVSTLQTDIQAIANGTATAETVSSYTEDLLNYIAEDQSIDSGEIAPDINAIADNVTTSEDTEVEINVLLNDSYVTSSPFSLSATNGTNGTTLITNNLITYSPDVDYNGSDSFSYTLTQGDKTSSAEVTITIEPVNDDPSIDIASTIQVEENQTAVTSVLVSDVDEDELTLTLGGTDAESFNLSDENVLTFKEAPDYEAKSSYVITLSLTDGTETVTKDVTINVINVNEGFPVFTSEAVFNVPENQTSIGTVTATDEEGDEVVFTVSGDELSITSDGVLTFISAPDYETKASYSATVTASNSTNSSTQDITVNVTNVVEETNEPVNQEHSINPTTLDVTSGDATLTFTIRVTDETGVDQTKLPQIQTYYSSAYDETIQRHDLSLTSGDKKDGTYTATATIPANSISGTWTLVLSRFEDENGIRQANATTYTFTVEGQDIETDPPVNQEHSINPTTLDVTSGDATLTFTIRVTDETGVDQTKLPQIQTYYSSAYDETIQRHDLSLTSGDKKDGTYTATATIPANSISGTWTLVLSRFEDENGIRQANATTYTFTVEDDNASSSTIYYLYGDSSQSTYLGCYGCGSNNAESICNESGTYGSSVGASSIWNTVGTYGSTVGTNSPWNSVGTNPPEFFNNKEKTSSYGKFTINTATANRTNITKLTNILDFFNNSNDNHSATRNYACSTSETSINVTVAPNNNGSGNVYVINGEQKPSLTLERGKSYTFVHPSGHPFRFSQTADGTHGFGSEYTSDVAKSSGSTTIAVGSSTPSTLYYYCSIHSGMGGSITIN
ncbi:Ig-like domain-containing protein [Gammaproteobacteria bacterium]|nr:Ig-like domain-containing protein [Gammaproteobacteria bacterium]